MPARAAAVDPKETRSLPRPHKRDNLPATISWRVHRRSAARRCSDRTAARRVCLHAPAGNVLPATVPPARPIRASPGWSERGCCAAREYGDRQPETPAEPPQKPRSISTDVALTKTETTSPIRVPPTTPPPAAAAQPIEHADEPLRKTAPARQKTSRTGIVRSAGLPDRAPAAARPANNQHTPANSTAPVPSGNSPRP